MLTPHLCAGHLYNSATVSSDPWGLSMYTYNAIGSASAGTGYPNSVAATRVVVVHVRCPVWDENANSQKTKGSRCTCDPT